MTRILLLFVGLFAWGSLAGTNGLQAQDGSLRLRGYVKTMPALRLDRDFSDPAFIHILHQRLNLRWDVGENWHIVAEGRNRLLYNDLFADFPQYKDILGADDGLMDLSWVWLAEGPWIGHSMADRLYVHWRRDQWQVRLGRQRINWGVNLVSNPNDLFNTYSFFDFDYVERPGADALRVQYNMGFASRLEVALSPGRKNRESTGALLWAFNRKGYDLQALAGYYQHRAAAGIGWAGHIGGAGFKGEVTWFYDLEEAEGMPRGNLVAATGLDYVFANGTFAVLEFLYNGGIRRAEPGVVMLDQPLRPDNIMFSEFATTLSLQHAFSSVLQGGLAVMALPDIGSAFVMPNLKYSLVTNLDLELVLQVFLGEKGSIFEQAGYSCFLALQYSF